MTATKTVKKKKAVAAKRVAKPVHKEVATPEKRHTYLFAVGRRKRAIARVRLIPKGETASVTVNNRPLEQFFTTATLQSIVMSPLVACGLATASVSARVQGGGVRGQAESVRLGIARTLLQIDPAFRATLKPLGYLRRDPRIKERKKYGLKRARRAPQWQKR